MQTLTKAVPAKLQLDGWWLDHDRRPFPKRVIADSLPATKAGDGQ